MLAAATPVAWLQAAVQRQDELLLDHANCEKKAASTALALMFAYPEDRVLSARLARLAREELRHFEQVDKVLQQRAVAPQRMAPGRYAAELRRALRNHEPQRKLDLMLVGALIEARSCERFELLARCCRSLWARSMPIWRYQSGVMRACICNWPRLPQLKRSRESHLKWWQRLCSSACRRLPRSRPN